MSLRTLAVMTCLLMIGGTAAAQDAPADPAADPMAGGDVGGEGATDPMAGGDTGGDVGGGEAAATEEGSGEVLPAEDAGGGDEKPISAGLLLGYGISLESGGNVWGLGFGVGGGYTLDMGLYLGAHFVYFLGEDPVNLWDLGLDVGYEMDVADKLTLRPQVGIGIVNVTIDVPTITTPFGTVGGGSASSSEFYLAPGAALLYDVSDSIFLGLDARLQLVLSDPMMKGITFLANGGMRF